MMFVLACLPRKNRCSGHSGAGENLSVLTSLFPKYDFKHRLFMFSAQSGATEYNKSSLVGLVLIKYCMISL